MHNLLERNLQESHNLQKQLESSSVIYGFKEYFDYPDSIIEYGLG
jgi:hypothetical protein